MKKINLKLVKTTLKRSEMRVISGGYGSGSICNGGGCFGNALCEKCGPGYGCYNMHNGQGTCRKG